MIRPLRIALLGSLALATPVQAQLQTHRFEVEVMSTSTTSGSLPAPYAGLTVGSMYAVEVDIDLGAVGFPEALPGSLSGAYTTYSDAIVQMRVILGGVAMSGTPTTSIVEIINDSLYFPGFLGLGECNDLSSLNATFSGSLPEIRLFFRDDVFDDYGPPTTCPTLFTSTALPNSYYQPGSTTLITDTDLSFPNGGIDGEIRGETVTIVAPSANNDCGEALLLTGYGSTAFDNRAATTTGSDLSGSCDFGTVSDGQIHNDLWFVFRPELNGCTTISTLDPGTGFDTKIAVYRGQTCPDDPGEVKACSDEEVWPVTASGAAGLDIVLSHGQLYTIRVGGGTAQSRGTGVLRVEYGSSASANDGGIQPGAPGCPSDAYPELCNGDGGDQMGCTDCPCSNNAPAGTIGGCLNTAGTSARLLASGLASVSLPNNSTIDLRFAASGVKPSSFCLLSSGASVAPANAVNPCFGLGSGLNSPVFDGLRCAVGSTIRFGPRSSDVFGDVGVTNSSWGGANGPFEGLATRGGSVAGQVRHFQAIYRDDSSGGCGAGLNTTQAVTVTFTP